MRIEEKKILIASETKLFLIMAIAIVKYKRYEDKANTEAFADHLWACLIQLRIFYFPLRLIRISIKNIRVKCLSYQLRVTIIRGNNCRMRDS